MASLTITACDISRARAIPGWMSELELEWLARMAATRRCIAEVGSWRGRSARAMADNLGPDSVIFCVDPWHDDAIGIPGWWTPQEDPAKYRRKDWLWAEFQANLADHLDQRVFPVRMFSEEGARALTMYQFDMIFIDATHDYAHVRQDIQLWRPLLKPDGVLCGHDYGEPTCPEVAPAVLSLIPRVDIVGTIWREVRG